MTILAGVRTSASLDWQASGGTAPYSQFFTRLLAFIALVNATPGNEEWQLSVLKRNTDATGAIRGMVLRLNTPADDWVLQWFHTDIFAAPTVRVGRLANWTDDGANGGYGTLVSAIDCLNGNSGIAAVPDSNAPAALTWAQDVAAGSEWFLFKADCTTTPMDFNAEAGGRPWGFLLYRQSNRPGWSVVFPDTLGLGCQLNAAMGYMPISGNSASNSQLNTFAARNFACFIAGGIDPSFLPPMIWMGRPNGYDWDYPVRLTHLFRYFDLDSIRYYQIGRSYYASAWLVFPLTALPPSILGWTSFAAWTGWTLGISDMVFIDGLPDLAGAPALADNGTTRAAHQPASRVMANPVLRAAFVADVQSLLGGGGATRPEAAVLWPRGQVR